MRKRTSVSQPLIVFRPVARVLAFAFVCVFAAASNCSAQSANCISVRALNSKSGKPLRNVSITMDASTPKDPMINQLEARTDSSGVARFCLTEPASNWLGLSFDAKFDSCSGSSFITAVIRDTGYLASNTQCEGRTFKFTEKPKPGELVILVRHVGLLERIWVNDWP
jgi:hypothetical protein